MKNIVCIGDSHTWGQGAGFDPVDFKEPLQSGEHRQLGFGSGCYVDLLRNYINERTGSYSGEITKRRERDLDIKGNAVESPLISVSGGSIAAGIKGSMFRLQFKCGPEGAGIRVSVDGGSIDEISAYDADGHSNNYKIWVYDGLEDKEHELVLEQVGSGRMDLFRIDWYGGGHAVINSGVGSCPAGRYLDVYWKDYVERYRPAVVVVEGFTINDWICGTTFDEYGRLLETMFAKTAAYGGKSVFLSVSPILGAQFASNEKLEYKDYGEAGIRAAKRAGVPVADAYGAMNALLPPGADDERKKEILFADAWHVNGYGHKVYYECIRKVFENEKLF